MTLRSFLPAAAVTSALAVMTAAYQLALHADLPPRPDADRVRSTPELPAGHLMVTLTVRSAVRDLVAREVIAGRTTVPEAAALYGWLDSLPPRRPVAEHDCFAALAGLPGPDGYTESELLGVRVVGQVALATRSAPPCPPGCVERARAEFLAARARGEFARLPASPADRCARLMEQARAEAQRVMSGRPDARSVQTAK